jgi:hypothetical protein
MTTTTTNVTLPEVAVGLGMTPDRLRDLVRRSPALPELWQTVGGTKFISTDHLPRVRELVGANRTTKGRVQLTHGAPTGATHAE